MASYDKYAKTSGADPGDVTGSVPATGVGTIIPTTVFVTTTAATTGSADDVTIFASTVPFKCKLLNVIIKTSTAVSMSTITLYSATSAGGTALSSAISTGSAVPAVDAITTGCPTLAAGSSIYARRSDRAVVADIILTLMPTL